MKEVRSVPFPQANNLELIYDILINVGETGLSKRDISQIYKLDERQGSYYLDSLEFLGFVEKINTKYFYTDNGYKVINSCYEIKKQIFIDIILTNVHISYLFYQTRNLSNKQKQIIISNYIFNNFGLGLNTAKRRSSTVISWFEWIETAKEKGEIQIE